MSTKFPVITIQCDWNEVVKLPKCKAWISSKYLNENSVHDELITSLNTSDGKIKIEFSNNYQYVSHGSVSLVVKHTSSGLKVAFVAPMKAFKMHKKGVVSVAASGTENALAVSSCDGDKLLVWDSRTGEEMLDLKGHGGPVYKSKFFHSGVVVISAGADGSCRIWSAENGANPVMLIGHKMAICDVCIVEVGRNVISVSKDGTAKLWDVGQAACLGNIVEGHGQLNCCALATTSDEVAVENEREVGTNNKLLVIGCESGLVVCAHVAKREELFQRQLDSACHACIVVEETVIVGCNNGKVILLNPRTGELLKELHESASPVLSMATLRNQMFAVGRQDGTCTIISLQDAHSAVRVQLTGSDCDGIRDLAFNGKWIFAACRDCNVRKYDFNQVIVHFK